MTDYGTLLTQLQEEYKQQLEQTSRLASKQAELCNREKQCVHRVNAVLNVLLELEKGPSGTVKSKAETQGRIVKILKTKPEWETVLQQEVVEGDNNEASFLAVEEVDTTFKREILMKEFIKETE